MKLITMLFSPLIGGFMPKFKTAPIENRLSDWRIMRRKGRMVRHQNMVTAEWDGWQEDAEYIDPLTKLAINTAYGRGKPLMGFDPALSGLLLDQMTMPTLKALADAQGTVYASRIRKPELIELLMPVDAVSAFPANV